MNRLLVDPETGETYEVPAADVIGVEPYDYAQSKRVGLALTREKRQTLAKLERAGKDKAAADRDYRRELAKAVLLAKVEHGATVAEAVAKGQDAVGEAHERFLAAESAEKRLHSELRLQSEDRATFHRWVEWSMKAPGGEHE